METETSIEEYKKYIRELKTRIKQLTAKNQRLVEDIVKYESQNSQQNNSEKINFTFKANKKAEIIQKMVRGFIARSKFKKMLKTMVNQKTKPRLATFGNEIVMTAMLKAVERIGLNLEMIYRAGNINEKPKIQVDEFRAFIRRLKLNVKESHVSRFLYLIDEDFTGFISEEEYLNTLTAFKVNSEPGTSQKTFNYVNKVILKFDEALKDINLNLRDFFQDDIVTYGDMIGLMDEKCSAFFNEKEKFVVLNYFDRKKLGYIEKNELIKLMAHINRNVNEDVDKEETNTEFNSNVPSNYSHLGPEKNINANLSLTNFVKRMEKYNKNLKQFFDTLALHVKQNPNEVKETLLSLDSFVNYLNNHYKGLLGKESVDEFIVAFKRLFMSNDRAKSMIDILELKNKLETLTNCKLDGSRLPLILFAINLDHQDCNTEDFIKRFRPDLKRKIDFSEFFILAQKVLKCNFNDVNHLFTKYDNQRRGMFELSRFIDDINSMRGTVSVKSNANYNKNNTDDSFKVKVINLKIPIVDKFMKYVERKMEKVNKSFDKVELRALLKEIMNGQLDDMDIAKISEQLDENPNGDVEFYEIVEYITTQFNAKHKIIDIYATIMANYVDNKRSTVKGFLANYSIYEEMSFDKINFMRKIKLVMGLTELHSEEFYDKLKKPDGNVIMSDFIELIKEKRKLDEKDCIDFKRESKSRLTLNQQSSMELNNEITDKDRFKSKKLISKPSIEMSDKTADFLISKIEEMKSTYIAELEALNRFILEHKRGEIHILQLKRFLKSNFDDRSSNILLNYIRHTDKNNNGYIDIDEWKSCALKLGLIKKSKAKKRTIKTIESNIDFYEYIVNELDDENMINRDFLEEFDSIEKKPVSVIQIKQLIKLKLQGFDVKPLLKLISFLDDNKNGFIRYSDFKFMLILMNNKKAEGDIDASMLRKYGLDINKIKKLGSADNSNEIDLFKFTKNIIKYLDNDEEELMVKYMVKVYNQEHNFNIVYDKLITQLNIQKDFGEFATKYDSSDCYEEWKNFKKLLLKNVANDDPIQETLKQLPKLDKKKIKKTFSIPFDSDSKNNRFINFIMFYDFDGVFSTRNNNNAGSLVKQKSLNKEDRIDLLENALNKLYVELPKISFNEILHKLEEILTHKGEEELTFNMFTAFIHKISTRVTKDEIFALFKEIDDDGNHHVSREEFLNFYEKSAKQKGITINKKDGKLTSSMMKNESQMKSFHEDKLAEKLRSYAIPPHFHFNGSKTILTDITATLKICFELISPLEGTDELFEDPEFGPNKNDMHGANSLYHGDPPPGYIVPEDMVWKRPCEISNKIPPVFLDEGASFNDVIQGAIGDCWFISALSILATDDKNLYHDVPKEILEKGAIDDLTTKELITGVYPKLFHFLARFGLYVFRFFKNYGWIFVIIDDRLPCLSGDDETPQLVFAKCHKRQEFWVPLIEKAYAKIHGTYEALISGQIDDGLVDMTGLVSEKLKITDAKGNFNQKLFGSKEKLWQRLYAELNNKSMLGCSIVGDGVESKVANEDGEFTGLYAGHAYSILDFLDIGEHKLVRIRNPWGSENPIEWTGPWADNSTELIENLDKINKAIKEKWKDEAELVEKENDDGAFFMSFYDFIRIWHNLSISKNFPDRYTGYRFLSEWNEKTSGGTPYSSDPRLMTAYMKNPQFIVKITKPTHIFMSLGQEDGRIKSRGEIPFPYNGLIHPLSLCVFKLEANEDRLEAFDGGRLINPPFIKNYRDVQVDIMLNEGKYAVVPSTKNEGLFGNFFLSIYFDCEKNAISIVDLNSGSTGKIIEEEEQVVKTFKKDFKELIRDVILEN